MILIGQGVSPKPVRNTVMHVRQRLGSSERRTGQVLDQPRSTQHYDSRRKTEDEDVLTCHTTCPDSMEGMAIASYPHSCVSRAWTVNHKKVERLGREEGLQVPGCHRTRKHL